MLAKLQKQWRKKDQIHDTDVQLIRQVNELSHIDGQMLRETIHTGFVPPTSWDVSASRFITVVNKVVFIFCCWNFKCTCSSRTIRFPCTTWFLNLWWMISTWLSCVLLSSSQWWWWLVRILHTTKNNSKAYCNNNNTCSTSFEESIDAIHKSSNI